MGAVMVDKTLPPARIGKALVLPTAQVLALRQRDPWKEATERARAVAIGRESLVLYVRSMTEQGITQNNAVSFLLEQALSNRLPAHISAALKVTAKAGRETPARSALCEWCAKYREGGVASLLPSHKGRVVEAAGWWGPCAGG